MEYHSVGVLIYVEVVSGGAEVLKLHRQWWKELDGSGQRFDCACARCSAPDIGPASSRFWQVGFQYRSSAPQTGFQYCAVDSITTSSTCCSLSHSASRCNCSGLLPYQRRSNGYSSSTSTSATTTASFFLWTSIPAILYAISILLAGAESVPEIH